MPSPDSTFRSAKLGDLIEFQRGFDLPQQNRIAGVVPIVSSSGVSDHNAEYRVKPPGVVTGRYGTIGKVFYLDTPFWPLNTTLWVKDFKGNIPKFVYYYLHTIDFSSCADKSSVPGVNRNDLHLIEAKIPAIPDQKAIADILSALDEKITLNRRMNKTLEGIARSIFKSWFVDFDPVHAKVRRRKPEGLTPELVALLPDRFSASPLGDIPAGWGITKLKDIAEQAKTTINPSKHGDERFLHYSLPAFDERTCPIEQFGSEIKSNKTLISSNHVLLSKLNPETPRVWLPGKNSDLRSICSTEFLAYAPRPNFGREYLYCLFLDTGFRNTLKGMVTGTSKSHQRVQPKAILELNCIVPPSELLAAFKEATTEILSKIEANRLQSFVLSQFRDALLPKLISGQIRVGGDVISIIDQLRERAARSCEEKGYVDTRKIASDLGLIVIKNSGVNKAQIRYEDGRFAIHAKDVNDNFSVGHELIHYASHQEQIRKTAVGRKDEYSLSPQEEKETDALAAEIVMPEDSVKNYLGVAEGSALDDKTVRRCAKQFRVSETAMRYRLSILGYQTKFRARA